MSVWVQLLIIGFLAVVLLSIYALEIHANNKRIARGEPPKRHHDFTDWPDPVYTIDITPNKRK